MTVLLPSEEWSPDVKSPYTAHCCDCVVSGSSGASSLSDRSAFHTLECILQRICACRHRGVLTTLVIVSFLCPGATQ